MLFRSSPSHDTRKDEFKNEITVKEGEVDIVSKKINLGKGKEKVVLGDTLKGLLDDTLDAISQISTVTAIGVQPITNIASFQALKSKTSSILSKLSNTD